MGATGRRIVLEPPSLSDGPPSPDQEGLLAQIRRLIDKFPALDGFMQSARDALDNGLAPGRDRTIIQSINSPDNPILAGPPENPTGQVAEEGSSGAVLRADSVTKQGIVTTKGDLLTFAALPDRLAVGVDGQVVTADSSAAKGLSYGYAPGAIADLYEGCVSFWRLDEATGAMRKDSIGRYRFNDLTPVNAPTQAAGIIGNAALFVAASSQYLGIADAIQQGLNPGIGDFSISIWFYPIGTTGSGEYFLVGKGATGAAGLAEGYGITLRGTTHASLASKISAAFGDNGGTGPGLQFHTTNLYTLNAWNHYLIAFDRSGNASVWLNGVAQAASSGSSASMSAFGTTSGPSNPAAHFVLGAFSQNTAPPNVGSYYDGRIDAVAYFNFAAGPTHAAALYNGGLGRELYPSWVQRAPVLSPAQITTNQNDYAPGTPEGVWRLSTSASKDVTGIAAGQDGILLTIINVGANAIVAKHQNAGSVAANRFLCKGAADITLAADEEASLLYDAVTARWRVTKL